MYLYGIKCIVALWSNLRRGNLEARLKLLVVEWSHQKEKGLPTS